jgi:lipoic acid synthetase
VSHGKPNELDEAEPGRVANAIEAMALKHAVITSVDRDDLADGGAGIFAETIRQTRERVPDCRIEVLIPDFQGMESSLRTVLDAGPDVLNHNIETVPRLYRMARSGGKYPRSLELLDRSRQRRPDIATKTGIMVGLGEEHDEILAVFDDLRRVGVSILTIGQYLRPSPTHAKMARYYHPDEFAALKRAALDRGLVHVESGPLVRSSYHAHEQADAFDLATRP